ncbi:MAG TPA: DUF2911 domain-containing protein [Alloacidobacterium sp.]|nr:DUF2911 domain-containing protein [Alloacidobacterium sp.]
MQRRRSTKTLCCVLFATITLLAISAKAQDDKKSRPSPPEQAKVTFGSKTLTIDYSAPSMKGRKIFGGLVPYDKVGAPARMKPQR